MMPSIWKKVGYDFFQQWVNAGALKASQTWGGTTLSGHFYRLKGTFKYVKFAKMGQNSYGKKDTFSFSAKSWGAHAPSAPGSYIPELMWVNSVGGVKLIGG